VSCHFRTNHTFWAGSQHDERSVGCTSCHSVHAPAGDKQLKASTEKGLCAQCHRTIVNKQYKFNHMPVREGKLSCSSCHNVHGSRNVKLLKEGGTVNESCVSCHGEKRGPHLWEHPPVTHRLRRLSAQQLAERQQDLRPILRGLPPAGPRVERPQRQGALAVGEEERPCATD
jgi:DmsE family decaheme c-type cytochrome